MKNKAKARGAISLTALSIAIVAAGAFAPSEKAFAQEALPEIDIGADRAPAQASAPAPAVGLPISSPDAIGSKAPPGSAPALAPSQAPLDSFEPTSVVSDKILRDVVIPSGDYNDAVKYTPGYASSNPNGPLGDAKGGWRGFQDGQYNITFDGIPFGDENDPTHHSAAYFPAAFLGKVTVNRGPGDASQVGYATFGGTLALQSFELSDTFGGNVQSSYGAFSTLNASATVQTGLDKNTGVRLLMQYNHSETAGALQYNSVETNQWLLKGDRQFERHQCDGLRQLRPRAL